MMRKRKDITKEEWIELGKEFKAVRDHLGNLSVKISVILPIRNADNLIKAEHIVDVVRSNLEAEMFSQGLEDQTIFYPGD